MKTFFLMRHAKSNSQKSGELDIERRLTQRGENDAENIGLTLKQHDITPDLIVTSPATRAAATCQIVAEKIAYPRANIETDKRLYLLDADELIDLIKELDDRYSQVMFFGHNPTFAQVACFFSNNQVNDMPTCSIAGFEFAVEHWAEITPNKSNLLFFEYPQ